MNRLARIAQSATPSTSAQFRKKAYGRSGVQSFLRDILAMANASADGPRYIITGAEFDRKGRRLGIQYALTANNLRSAAKGKLRLVLQ